MRLHLCLLVLLALATGCRTLLSPPIELASAGTSPYQIIAPAEPTPLDTYAMEQLQSYLQTMTGATLPIVASADADTTQPSIIIGDSPIARQYQGRHTVETLGIQEHIHRTQGQHILLYGEGKHGNLNAIMAFLREQLGWRWYTVFDHPVTPQQERIVLRSFNHRDDFAYLARETQFRDGFDYFLQSGVNQGFQRRFRARDLEPPAHHLSYLPTEVFVHSLFAYMPPTPDARHADEFPWMKKRDYFATHPEFFSLNAAGTRVPSMQVCFANPDLRAELTRNILRHLEISGTDQTITVDAADTPGKFCHCDGCQALEEQYASPGGPLYDYLIELCDLLAERHPGVYVRTLAYRLSQSQQPPKLANGEMLPENLIVAYAPIEDNYFADWTHPDPGMQQSYEDFLGWAKVTHHLWAWIYPNPWGTGLVMPVGNIERTINYVRMIHAGGGTGLFVDHSGLNARAGFSELQQHLILRLMDDIDADADAIIREFTDYQYGAAGPLMRQYLDELEAGRKAMDTLPPDVRTASRNFDDVTFPYLTPANIHRWQIMCEEMLRLTADQPREHLNVQLVRRELDFATLWKWFELKEIAPQTYTDAEIVAARIHAANEAKSSRGSTPWKLGEAQIEDFLAIIRGGGQERPLPSQFDGIDPQRIKQFIPRNYSYSDDRKTVLDPDAARGYAATVAKPDLPFQVGFYQWTSRNPSEGVHGARLKIDLDAITPGVYRFYELGDITVTPDCWIWFSAASWQTHLEVGNRIFEIGENNEWRAWVSLKFDGPTYGGTAETDSVLCDRIVLVKTPPSEAAQ